MKRIVMIGAVLLAMVMAQSVFAAERHIKMDDQGGWVSVDQKDTIIPDGKDGWFINGQHFVPDGPDAWKSDDGKITVKLDGAGGWWINDEHFFPDGKGGWTTEDGKTVKPSDEGGLLIDF